MNTKAISIDKNISTNLELLTIPTKFDSSTRIEKNFITKKEHKKIKGFFIQVEGSSDIKYSTLKMRVNSKNIIGFDFFLAKTVLTTDNLSYKDVFWDLDVPVEQSEVQIVYQDWSGSPNYQVYFNFIMER